MVRVALWLAIAVTYARLLDSHLLDDGKQIGEKRDVTKVGTNPSKRFRPLRRAFLFVTAPKHYAFHLASAGSVPPLDNENILSNEKSEWPFESVTFNHPIQSPVDLITSKAVTMDLPMLDIIEKHLEGIKAKVYNSGHTVKVFIKKEPNLRPSLTGGPLLVKYQLEQMHFHWGTEDIWGSEHFVDGESFAVEIHSVHYNSKYKTFEEAAKEKDGLAVLTVFAEAGETDNPLLEPLHELLPLISEANSFAMLDALESIQWPASALSTNSEYYTYPGSLTTEPYSENVIFILLPKPVSLSFTQLNAFRSLHTAENGFITDNKRNLQPFHNRPIIRSTKLQ